MRKLVLLGMLAVCLSGSAFAQTTPQAEVFGGYSYARSAGENFHGWNAAVQGNFNQWFSVVGDFSGHYTNIGGIDADIHTFTAGPRFTYRNEANVTPFAHALFGGARVSGSSGGLTVSDTGWAMNLGGGVDWNVNERFSVRLIQADALVTRFNGNREVDPRLSFGVVIKFGSK